MSELIPIGTASMGGAPIKTVNARDLHAGLEVRKDFSDWIKVQVSRANLRRDKDYVVLAECHEPPDTPFSLRGHADGTSEGLLPRKGENPPGGRPRIEYHLTLEAAKHVAMMAGTQKGYEVREYFLECERRVNNPALSLTRLDLFRMGLEAEERAIAAEAEARKLAGRVEVLAPKAHALDRLSNADGDLCIRDAAKVLQVGERELVRELMARRWTYRRPGNRKPLIAHADVLARGLLVHKVRVIEHRDGEKIREQVLVTPKGLARLAEIFSSARPEPTALPA